MSQFDEMIELKRHLQRREVDLARLPPFALSPAQTLELKKEERFFQESCGPLNDNGVFTVHGLWCVRSDRLTGS